MIALTWVRLAETFAPDPAVELVAVPAFAATAGAELDGVSAGPLARHGEEPLRIRPGHPAGPGEIGTVLASPAGPEVVTVGLGERAGVTVDRLRTAAMALGSRARGYRSVATTLALVGADRAAALAAVVEGFQLGAYRYRDGPDGAGKPPGGLTVYVGTDPAEPGLLEALAVAIRAGEAVRWVRSMVDTPPTQLTPAIFAGHIDTMAAAAGVGCEVWSLEQARRAGFGGTAGVGGGSANPPVVVRLTYPGDGRPAALGLAGKGITFDAGGINLKRDPDEISWMKSDMAGAAAVAAAVCAAAGLGSAQPVVAVLPLAENLPGRGALLPGDVVTHPDGTHTEVLDTDNEGRLVLADAIAYLASQQVSAIIDVGTLTDGGAVGHLLWGCWGTSSPLVDRLLAAGARVGDAGWALPLRVEYRALFDSVVADRANRARDVPDSGTMAATFLRDFPGSTAWAHVDNGSTAYLDADLPPWPHGPTGSPTRALLELLLEGLPN